MMRLGRTTLGAEYFYPEAGVTVHVQVLLPSDSETTAYPARHLAVRGERALEQALQDYRREAASLGIKL